jgi:hypothetical protein
MRALQVPGLATTGEMDYLFALFRARVARPEFGSSCLFSSAPVFPAVAFAVVSVRRLPLGFAPRGFIDGA